MGLLGPKNPGNIFFRPNRPYIESLISAESAIYRITYIGRENIWLDSLGPGGHFAPSIVCITLFPTILRSFEDFEIFGFFTKILHKFLTEFSFTNSLLKNPKISKPSNDFKIVGKWVMETIEGAKWPPGPKESNHIFSRPIPAVFPAESADIYDSLSWPIRPEIRPGSAGK